MNRYSRRCRRSTVHPGGRGPRTVRTTLLCVECGEVYTHLEVMPWDDKPHGPPAWLSCTCGGRLSA